MKLTILVPSAYPTDATYQIWLSDVYKYSLLTRSSKNFISASRSGSVIIVIASDG